MKAGLCENCRNVEVIASRRGSRFYMCTLAAADARFAKYPRLPVLSCPGYERRAEKDAQRKPEAGE